MSHPLTGQRPNLGQYAPLPRPVARTLRGGWLDTSDRRIDPDRWVMRGLILCAIAVVALGFAGLL